MRAIWERRMRRVSVVLRADPGAMADREDAAAVGEAALAAEVLEADGAAGEAASEAGGAAGEAAFRRISTLSAMDAGIGGGNTTATWR